MTNQETMELCLALMKADSEDEVIDLLRATGFWDEPAAWRYYGDYENNYNIIGNQQSSPDAALIEKLINAIDARLMSECLVRGIDPEGSDAPRTFEEATAFFFPPAEAQYQLREEAVYGVTLAATGAIPRRGHLQASDRNPCFIIADCGEGQTPEMMPETLLSLTRANKLRIPFVQGKFNMGGTGVLKFCGHHGLQLIVSRRNPAIVRRQRHVVDPSDHLWDFTVVRRENPVGGRRSSVYDYLAPLNVDLAPNEGGVLRFSADMMPIFPEGRNPYGKEAGWGTLVKLYDYAAVGFRSNILLPEGLLTRANLLLPEVALPVRLYECREFRGYAGPREGTLTGLGIWRRGVCDGGSGSEDLELVSSSSLSVAGEPMTATIFAFKRGRAADYRRNEGILFTVNGQTQGYLTEEFFTRATAGNLGYIQSDLLVIVDCSDFSGRAREDLFMSSRDRLSRGELRSEIERALEDLLRNHEELRALKDQRRREEIASALDGSTHLKEAIEVLLRHTPTLSQLFMRGDEIEIPTHPPRVHRERPFVASPYPTYFNLPGREDGRHANAEGGGEVLTREVPLNQDVSITFETDAADDYFDRGQDKGEFSLYRIVGDARLPVADFGVHLHRGVARLHTRLPKDSMAGDILHYSAVVRGPGQREDLRNCFAVAVSSAEDGTASKRKARHVAHGISLPPVEEVTSERWVLRSPPFDQYTALRVVNAGVVGEGDEQREAYDFYVNLDNIYLARELRAGDQEPELTKAQFELGLILLALALLHQDAEAKKTHAEASTDHPAGGAGPAAETGAPLTAETAAGDITGKIDYFTRAVAPFLVPIVRSLASLGVDEPSSMAGPAEAATQSPAGSSPRSC
jgi:hypothetical protein